MAHLLSSFCFVPFCMSLTRGSGLLSSVSIRVEPFSLSWNLIFLSCGTCHSQPVKALLESSTSASLTTVHQTHRKSETSASSIRCSSWCTWPYHTCITALRHSPSVIRLIHTIFDVRQTAILLIDLLLHTQPIIARSCSACGAQEALPTTLLLTPV